MTDQTEWLEKATTMIDDLIDFVYARGMNAWQSRSGEFVRQQEKVAALRAHLSLRAVPQDVAEPVAQEATTPRSNLLPRPGSPEASAMIDSLLAEYQWPSNTKNAARAGYEAVRRLLELAQPVPAATPPVVPAMTRDVHLASGSPDDLNHLGVEAVVALGGST